MYKRVINFQILKAAQKYLYANQLGELNANNEEKRKEKRDFMNQKFNNLA